MLAVAIANRIAQILGLSEGNNTTEDRVQGASGRVYRRVSSDTLLRRAGAKK